MNITYLYSNINFNNNFLIIDALLAKNFFLQLKSNMKILSFQANQSINNSCFTPTKKNSDTLIEQKNYTGFIYNANFCGDTFVQKNAQKITQSAYISAKKYLNMKKNSGVYWKGLEYLNLNNLDGIQKDIKVFHDFSIKEIKFLVQNLSVIMVHRGCSNRCSHCAANAIPQHFSKDSEMISSMSWDDYNLLMDGINKLNSRLEFNVFNCNDNDHISLFHDADCIELEMRDKRGKVYDFTDAHMALFDATHKLSLFDTSGWYPKSEKMQKRAEKIVSYLSNNRQKFDQINISINPFHALLEKSNELAKSNDFNEAGRYRSLYTDRMANAIFTFTPLVEKNNFHFISRAKSDDSCHSGEVLTDLKSEILKKLEDLYKQDFSTSKRFIQDESQITEKITVVAKKLDKNEEIRNLGRAENLFVISPQKEHKDILVDKNTFFDDLKNQLAETAIDANGKIYATNSYLMAPTNLKLNFSNRNKSTIAPEKVLNAENVKIANNIIQKFIIE